MITSILAKDLHPGDQFWEAGNLLTVQRSVPFGFEYTDESGIQHRPVQVLKTSDGQQRVVSGDQVFHARI